MLLTNPSVENRSGSSLEQNSTFLIGTAVQKRYIPELTRHQLLSKDSIGDNLVAEEAPFSQPLRVVLEYQYQIVNSFVFLSRCTNLVMSELVCSSPVPLDHCLPSFMPHPDPSNFSYILPSLATTPSFIPPPAPSPRVPSPDTTPSFIHPGHIHDRVLQYLMNRARYPLHHDPFAVANSQW